MDSEQEFLRLHREALPTAIADSGIPHNLQSARVESTPDDQRVLEEDLYWGEFMKAYWDVGDRSIFDVRVPATHPAFYGVGVLEPDERDRDRICGVWPDHLQELVFGWMAGEQGSLALDVGCGGGQYGLEASRRGLRVVGIDPSRVALDLARSHALDTGAELDYVRADPAQPPFRSSTFDVVMSKDSLHHVPDIETVLDRLDRLLRPGGLLAIHEHIGRSPRKRRLLGWLQPRLIPRIQRRYGTVKVPDVLLHESPNEDVGMARIEPELRRRYTPLLAHQELFLYFDVEQLVYYAYGKRKWPARVVRIVSHLIEKVLLATGEPPEHLTFVARKSATRAATPPTGRESEPEAL